MAQVEECDVLIIGTDLSNAILAAALQASGKKVIHIDQNDFYGAGDSSMAPPFDFNGLDSVVSHTSVTEGGSISKLGKSRDYNIELTPRVLFASSSIISSLRDLSISDYMDFKALRLFYIYQDGKLVKAPSSKEDIFTDAAMPLMTKRRLMKFLKAATSGDDALSAYNQDSLQKTLSSAYKLEDHLVNAICYSLALSLDPNTTVQDSLKPINAHLKSIGLFGNFPAVVTMYGAGSELSQAYCRKAAVHGCTYILGQKIIKQHENSVELESGLRLNYKHVVSTEQASATTWRKFVIVDDELPALLGAEDAACVAFPPKDNSPPVQCQIHGSGTGACPPGQTVIYLMIKADEAQATQLMDEAVRLITASDKIILSRQYDAPDTADYDDMLESARTQFISLGGKPDDFLVKSDVNQDLQHDEET